ncbi:VOC family protein [Flavobacterium sp.]|jgi:extradiol dioxygenase family protein|uniref:VOC family protein n=1 Tax=Flavobacterium sp. TaxID=239 RepID=UPI0022BE1C9B|nr:VOC family protein [Flavobacterium sp.]MCZ8229473.1 VOC family protein [Flavobacterium sp.]
MKRAITYSLFLWSICLFAQEKTTLGLTLNHLAISVKDVNTAATFYSKVLYLTKITNRTQKEGIRWFSLGDGKELHLVSTIPSPVTINKAVHLALTTPHFDALIKQLQKEHIPYSD